MKTITTRCAEGILGDVARLFFLQRMGALSERNLKVKLKQIKYRAERIKEHQQTRKD